MIIKMTDAKLGRVQSELKETSRRFRDLTPVLKIGALRISELLQESFRTESSPDGTPWKPLAESTLEARARLGNAAKRRTKKGALTKGAQKIRTARLAPGGIKKLVITGRLKNSLFARAEKTKIWFGGNVDYFGPNQAGTDDGELPARPMAPVEKINGHWQLMNRGRAQLTVDAIKESVRTYITSGSP